VCIKTAGSSLAGGAVEAVVRGLADEAGDDGSESPALNPVTSVLNISRDYLLQKEE
jgi:hypothetical protein